MSDININRATNLLSKYYGLFTLRDFSNDSNNSRTQEGNGQADNNSNNISTQLPEVGKLIELLIDTSEGGITTVNLIRQLNNLMTNTNNSSTDNIQNRINEIIKVFYERPGLNGADNNQPTITDLLGAIRQERIHHINSTPNSVSKTSPGLSVIQVNHIKITPATKNSNAITIFMNGIPSIELTRSIPYINIEFQFARPPTDSRNRAQTLSLFKLLEGAAIVDEGTVNRKLLDATKTNTEIAGQPKIGIATAGMELFTTPQTLVNANSLDSITDGHGNTISLRTNSIQDKFRPFLSIKNLTVEVQPSGGLMSFKTAKLEITLHDKSRLAEIADFISPNLYGQTELLIEYGWSHPDGPEVRNSFADIINGMRVKEKYGIINSSFVFDDVGQVQITLSLAMRGGAEFRTETIGDDNDSAKNILRKIEELETAIGELRRRQNQNHVQGVREIRGVQILDAAADARSNIVLSEGLREALRDFQDELKRNRTNNPNLTKLNNKIIELYGTARRTNANRNIPLTEQLRSSVRRNIRDKIEQVMSGADPFLVHETQSQQGQERNSGARRNGRRNNNNNNEGRRQKFSLGKLLLHFIGHPLAATGKFDDVQLIFYPFNAYAGKACNKNISQFSVDKNYFINQYSHYRLDNISRSANIQLKDFLSFISSTILDDNASESYGLQAFHHQDTGTGNNAETTIAPNASDAVLTQNRIDNALRGITPDGSFKQPQIDFYIEAIPEDKRKIVDNQTETVLDESKLKTILRVHIFDKQATSYEGEGALLSAMRDEIIMRIDNVEPQPGSDPGVARAHTQQRNQAIERAIREGIIERVQTNQPTSQGPDAQSLPNGIYRIAGGPAQIKEFIKKTTPYILHSCIGSTVKNVSLSSMQDQSLSTVNLLRSLNASPIEPEGTRAGGLPMQIIPCQIDMQCFGNPLLEFGFQCFIDMNTGTSVDDLSAIVGLTHTLSNGVFETEIKWVPLSAWGKYSSLIERLGGVSVVLDSLNSQNNQ